MCVYCMLCLQGKGDRTGKLYWASLVELAELAGISGRAGLTLTSRAPCWVTRHRGTRGRPGQCEWDNHTDIRIRSQHGANYFIGP